MDKKKEKLAEAQHQNNPQLALEKILTAEISVAQKVSEAREKADKAILAAQSAQAQIKEQIQADARAQRDITFAEGVRAAREASDKLIEAAQTQAEKDKAYGQQFLDEAVEVVMDYLIGQDKEQL